MNFQDVKKIGLGMPGVEEGTAYGSPALKLGGKLLACVAINKSAEPNSLAVSVAFKDRSALIEGDPDTYYVTDHYIEYPIVLARLSRIHADALKDVLSMALRLVKSKANPRKKKRMPANNLQNRLR